MDTEPPFQESNKGLFEKLMKEDKSKNPHDHEAFLVEQCDLPLVDLAGLNLGEKEREECKREIADAAKSWGFFQVVNHGISRDVLERVRQEQMKMFRQPFCRKVGDNLNCYGWGNPAATTLMQFSWSEAFHIPLYRISELEVLKAVRLFADMVFELAQKIAEILAENVGCKSSFFQENCLPSTCFLRLNRYPPCSISTKVFGLVPHTDSDVLTILYQDQVGGLQLVKDGEWISVKPIPDALIINIGDIFQAWSNNVYKSIKHRVVVNAEVERFSVGYFFCPSYDTIIQSCSRENSIYREFCFREYRQQVQEDVKSTGNKIGLPRFHK